MNRRCYKTIFSKRLGALVAVGEHASSQTKSPGEGSAAGSLGWGDVRFVGLLAIGFASVSLGWSQTLPQGAQVTQGGVSVSQSGSQMAITQTTPKAVVNWQSFDIGQNAKVNVLQPNSQSVLLNRVLSDNPTQILGQLQANGQVVLVNPKGIVVGSDGSVNASAFTASSLNISDADFMAGVSRYVRGDATGSVINKGMITSAPGGYVALLGPTVQNEGRIVSPQGAVVLGAGDVAVLPQALTESLYMPVGRTGKIKLELTPATVNAWVKNEKSGVIVTEGGQVYMQAAAVHSAMASVLQSGSINTSAAQAGEVHLLADGGRIVVDGQIKANSSATNAKGGSILIGRDVDTGVLAASTDVSGATLESHKGFVETSGQHLVVDGIQVKAGEWLLDPTDITIGAAATSGIASSGTNPITQNPNTSGATASTISATTLASTLSGGTSVVVRTTNTGGTGNGDITVASNIAVTGAADATLTLQAERDIVVNAGVSIARTGSNKLNVVFNSDLDGNGAGAIVMNTGSAITSNGGNISLGGGSNGDASNYARGYSTRSNGLELISNTINAGGGNISINGFGGSSSTASGRGVVMTNSTISTTGSGAVSVIGIGRDSTNVPASFSLGHNNGVLLDGGSVKGGSSGSTWIWGKGGAGASAYNYGISITNSATVTSTGGNVTLQGTGGGTGSSDRNVGVQISQSAQVTSNGGNVNVEGTGGNTTGGLNAGVAVVDGGKITVSGTRNLTVTATGGGNSSTSGGDNMGLWMAGSGTGAPLIESASGNISINGAAGGATTSGGRNGVSLTGSSKINSTAGQVTLSTDSINLADSSLVSANTTSGTVTVRNRTAGALINVGGTAADAWVSVPNTLAVSQAEMGKISAATTVIGRNDATGSGNLTVTGPVNMGTMGNPNGNLTLISGASMAVNESITKTAGVDATVTMRANEDITLTNNKTISATSGKLNVVVNSDADANSSGAIRFNGGSSISSNGGSIKLGGGFNASGYAVGNSTFANGILLDGASLLSAGGDISLMGRSSAGNNNDGDFASAGVRLRDTAQAIDINSGSGTILMDGVSQSTYTGGNAHGVHIGGYGVRTTVQSSSSAANAIDIKGVGAANSSNVAGVFINSTASVLSTGTGGIAISGEERRPTFDGNNSETAGVFIKRGHVLSASGQISMTGISNLNHGIDLNWSGGFIGGKAATAVPSSTANIVLTSNNMWLGSTNTAVREINTTGTVTLKTIDAATTINLGAADVTGASKTLGLTETELGVIKASNLVIGSSLASNITTSSNVTTAAATGNVTLLTAGGITVNNALTVGGATATKNLTINATGATSTVTDGASGAIKATGLELLGATAAYTLDSTANAVSTLAGSTGSVTFVDSTALQVGTVNTINSANTSTGTVGLTTSGNINLTASTSAASTNGLLVSNVVRATGSGSITLNGTASGASSGQGVYLGANVTANTGGINITGLSSATSPVGTGVYVGGAVSSNGAIALTGTGRNIGVNLDTPGSVVSLANGSNFAGTDAITITGTGNGTSPFAGVLLRNAVNNNSSNGATTIKSLSGNVMVEAGTAITNASSAGAISIAAGDGTAASTAAIVYNYTSGTVPQITQNANADVVLTTDGQGDLSSPKIVKSGTGAGDIVLSAGKLLAAGVATGGQVKPVAGNSVTNSGTGSLFVYSGSPTSANTAAMSSLDASLANLYLSAAGTNAQIADANVAYATSGVRNTIAGGPMAQVLFREKVSVGTISGATLAKTYGDANTGSTETAALWTDMTAALKTANATSGVSNVNSTSTTAGTLQVTSSAIVDTLTGSLQSTAYSTSQKLKANSIGYSYSGPTSSKYTTALTAGQSAIVTVALKALTPSVTANNKVYNDSTAATLASQTVSGAVSGDVVSLSSTGATFDTQHVGTGKTVTATGLSLSGTDATNYSLPSNSTTTTANVTVKALTLAATTDTKTYDGTTSSSATVTITGLEGDDKATASQAFASKNVMGTNGSSLQVNSGFTINDGNSGNNYSVTTNTATGTIAKADLTVAMSAQTKTYNGTTAATLASGAITATGVTVNGAAETASVNQTVGTYNSKDVATATAVTASLASNNFTAASGVDLNNYNLPTTVTGTGTIAKADLTVAMSDQAKTYDGTTAATLASGAITATTGVTVNNVTETISVNQTSGTYNNKNVSGASTVTASLASSNFTAGSSTDLNNYNLPASVSGNGAITAKSVAYVGLTVSDKTYDRTTAATLGGTAVLNTVTAGASQSNDAKVIATDTVSLTGTAVGTYVSKDVAATNNTVTFSGLSLTGGDAGNYTLVQQASVNGTGTIKAKTLTASVQANDKTYDGTANATLKSTNGMSSADVISGDSVTFSNSSVSFADRHVAKDSSANVVGKTVTVSGLALGGADASNYALASTSATTTAKITPKALTLAAVTDSKTYDSNTSSSGVVTALALESVDTVTATQSFTSKDVMGSNGSTLQVNSGYTINDSNSGNNYTVSTSTATGTISQKALTVTANNDARFVTQADASNFKGVSYSGFAGTEDASVLGGTLSITRTDASANVAAGTYAGSLVPRGLTSGNYNISYVNGDYTIVPANKLLISTTNVEAVYGTAPTYETTAQYLDGNTNLINTLSQSINGSTYTFSDGVGGSVSTVLKPYTVSGSTTVAAGVSTTGKTVVGSYSILDINPAITGSNFVGSPVYVGTLTVKPKALTAAMSASNKVYDGGVTAAVTGSSTHIVAGDKVSFANTSATFNNKNAGTGKTVSVTGISISGDDAGNYALQNTTASTTAAITPKAITLTAGSVSKTYDGGLIYATQVADLTTLTNQLISGDSVSAATISYADKNAANGTKVVTLDAVTLSDGNSGGNYTVTRMGNSTSTITPKALTAAFTANNKVYDGNTTAAVVGTSSDIVSGDTVNFANNTATFDNKSVGSGKAVSVSGIAVSGTDAANYELQNTTASTSAQVTTKAATVNGTATSKTYNGLTQTQTAATSSGFVNGDAITISGESSGKNAGTYTSSLAVGGADAGNYSIAITNADLTIAKADLTVAMSAQTKTYNGTTAATLASGAITATGVTVNGAAETASVNQTVGTYNSKDVATATAVTASLASNNFTAASGVDLNNYNLPTTVTGTGTIAKADLTVAMSDQAKTYDGTTAATLASGAITATTGVTVNNVTETISVNQTSGTYNNKNVSGASTVTASLASSNFTAGSSTDLNNYNLPASVSGNGAITAKSVAYVGLTVSDKTYDRTTAATLGGTAVLNTVTAGASQSNDAKVIATDTVSLTGTAVGTYVSKDVAATNNTVTFSGLSLTGGDAGNYTLVQQASVNGTGTIKAKTLTASVQANDKTYDGTANATLKSTNGMSSADVISGDSVTFSNSSVSFADRHVAKDSSANVVGKTVTVSGLALGGADASNYALASTSATTTAKITPKALTLAAVTDSKTYDSNTSSSGVVTALALESVDTVTATQSFTSKDVMGSNGSTLQVNSGYTINDSNSGNNYTVSTSTATGTISQKALTVTANNDARFVTQADASNFKGVSYSGFAGTEDASVLGGTLSITRTDASANVAAGTYAGSLVPRGLTSGNYNISYVNGDYTIVPANKLLISTTNVEAVYGTAPTYETTAQYLDGNTNLINTLSQSINGSTYTFSDGVGGSVSTVLKPYTVSGSTTVAAGVSTTGKTVVGSYSILDINPAITGSNFVGSPVYVGTLTVKPKALTAAMSASNKVYDGGVTAAVTGSSTHIVAGDKVSFANTSATFNNKNAGTGKTVSVTGISISGDDAGNYALQNTTASTTAAITPKAITLTAGSVSKTYDGGLIYATQVADLTTLTNQLISGDSVSAATISYADKNAANGTKVVTLDAVTLSDGNSGGNYTVTRMGNSTSTITPKAITLSAGSVSKTYDGGLSYTTQVADLTTLTNQLISGDSVSAATISYADKNAANGTKVVTLDAVILSDGNSGGNYTVTLAGNSTSTITQKALTAAYTASNKVYDGTRLATVSGASSDIITNDNVTFTNASATFDTKNVGTGKAVDISGISISGTDAGNYILQNTTTSTTANVTPKALTAAYTASNKVYDGTRLATVSGASSDIVASDTVSFANSAATFDTKNVGTGKTVDISGISISGTDAGNYSLQNNTASTTADVTKKSATITGTTTNVTYNATTQTQSAAVLAGFIASDVTGGSVGATGLATGRNAGSYTSNLSAIGADAGNYNVTVTNADLVVGKKALVLSAVTDTKTYDGRTNSSGTLNIVGLEGSDTVSATQSFASKNVMGSNGSTLQVNSGYTINDGNSGNNYTVSTSTATGTISQKALTVTANADAKFVTQADAAGYNGVSYSGFAGLEDASVLGGTMNITRTNASSNVGAGTYAGSLVPSGLTSGNYTISYATGDYTIVPANQLLIRTNNVSTINGTVPTYSTTAQYLDGANVIHTLTQSGTGNSFTFNDGAGGSVTTVLKPYTVTSGTVSAAGLSSSGNTVVGNYSIWDTNPSITGSNFLGSPVYVGNLTVTPKPINSNASGLSKVYDGTTSMGNATLSLVGQLAGDRLGVNGVGSFSQKNVGFNLSYVFTNVTLTGPDHGNYFLSGGNSLTGTNGTITPAPLTFIGTQVADKNYDGTTWASVSAGRILGLVGNETLRIAQMDGDFESSSPGTHKNVKVVYHLTDGDHGGLASNYTWSPVVKAAQIFSPAKDQRYKPEVPSSSAISRVRYLGFNGMSGAAVSSMFRAPWLSQNSPCTASRLENCICKPTEEPLVEICVAPTSDAPK
jgi:filamentous hemagglutinin family protein